MLKDKIIFYRKKNGLSQEELANRLLVSRQTVSQWETGQTQPTIDNLIRLKEIFGVGFDALLEAEEPTSAGEAAADGAAAAFDGGGVPAHGCIPAEADGALERVRFALSEADVKKGLRGGWQAYLLAPLAIMLGPLAGAFKKADVPQIIGMLLWCVLCIVLYAVRFRRRRAYVLQRRRGEEEEIGVYRDYLQRTVLKDGETVQTDRMRFDEIRRADDLRSLYRFADQDRAYLLPKSAVPSGSALQVRLADKIKETKLRMDPARTLLLIVGMFITLYLVSNAYLSLCDSAESLSDLNKYIWIPLLGLPLPAVSIWQGIVRVRQKRGRGVVLIVLGVLFLLGAVWLGVGPYFMVQMQKETQAAVAQIEEAADISLPQCKNVSINSYQNSMGDRKPQKILIMTMERDVSLAFDKEVEKEPKWLPCRQAARLAPVWNDAYSAESADYVMCVNLTDGAVNALPTQDGKYRFLNLLYDVNTETIYAVWYKVDYRRNG